MLEVKLECIRPDVKIHYTTDGSEPTATSPLYEKIVPVREPLTLKSTKQADGENIDTPCPVESCYHQTCTGRQSGCKAPDERDTRKPEIFGFRMVLMDGQ